MTELRDPDDIERSSNELLELIFMTLKKIEMHLSIMTDAELNEEDVGD